MSARECDGAEHANLLDEIESLRVELMAKDQRVADLEGALCALVARLDSHFGGHDRSQDWAEQEQARAVLSKGGAS